MIIELFTYIREKFHHPHSEAFGHLVESISLHAKEQRCREAWRSHRQAAKQFIIKHCSSLKEKQTAIVLGSGPLHEIPIEWLSENFEKVFLVDVVHLQSTKKSVRHLKNLEFIIHDISELEADLQRGIISPKVPEEMFCQAPSVVISANLLSQIPLHLERFLTKKMSTQLSDSEREEFLLQSSLNHIRYLHKFPSKVLLFTDIERRFLDEKGNLLEIERGHELNLPSPVDQWLWDVSPLHEYTKNVAIQMKVCGYVLKEK